MVVALLVAAAAPAVVRVARVGWEGDQVVRVAARVAVAVRTAAEAGSEAVGWAAVAKAAASKAVGRRVWQC